MRHTIKAIALGLVTLLCLSGCSLISDLVSPTTSGASVENTASLTYPPTVTTKPKYEIFHKYPSVLDVDGDDMGICPEYVSYETKGSDGDPLLKIRMTLPLPVISSDFDTDLKESIEKSFSQAKEELEARIKVLEDSCLSDKMGGYEILMTPTFSVSYTLTAFSSDFVSILYSVSETNSDGMTTESYICSVIDLKAGFTVDISTLFSAGISDKLTSLVAQKLAESGKVLFDGYDATAAAEMSSCWIISGSDVELIFPPQTIAPASEGTITVTLENAEINELLGDYGAALLGDLPASDPDIDGDEDN